MHSRHWVFAFVVWWLQVQLQYEMLGEERKGLKWYLGIMGLITEREVTILGLKETVTTMRAHSPRTVPDNTSSLRHVLLLFLRHERRSYR